jgi:hypothetical protein
MHILFQYALVISLADLLPAKVLESGPQRAVNVMILTQKTVLPRVAERVKFVAPMAHKVEPACWCARGESGATQDVLLEIVCVRFQIQERIPERSSVCGVVEDTAGEDVGMDTGCGVHGVASGGRESEGLNIVSINPCQLFSAHSLFCLFSQQRPNDRPPQSCAR